MPPTCHFRRGADAAVPEDLRPILERAAPIIGYHGALARWIDYDLLRAVARRRPDREIVLIGMDYDGSLGRSGLLELPNVHYLGVKPYAALPAYVARFAVGIIPFAVNHVTEATSPIKMFEYLAARKPVVATDVPECRRYRSVLIGRDHDEFVARLDEALALRSDPEYLARLDQEADANGWEERARLLLAEVARLAAARGWEG